MNFYPSAADPEGRISLADEKRFSYQPAPGSKPSDPEDEEGWVDMEMTDDEEEAAPKARRKECIRLHGSGTEESPIMLDAPVMESHHIAHLLDLAKASRLLQDIPEGLHWVLASQVYTSGFIYDDSEKGVDAFASMLRNGYNRLRNAQKTYAAHMASRQQ